MDKHNLHEFETVLFLMEQLDEVITAYKIQHGVAPVAYSYLYELCILRLLELFKGNPEFIKGVSDATTSTVLALLKLIQKPVEKDKELTDKLNKFKELLAGTNIVIPDTVNKFLKKYPHSTCSTNENMDKNKSTSNKLIDEYLKKKKLNNKKKRNK